MSRTIGSGGLGLAQRDEVARTLIARASTRDVRVSWSYVARMHGCTLEQARTVLRHLQHLAG